MTGSVAAITATGAWYGAGLKTRQEFKQEKQARIEATPEAQIESLEGVRARLLQQRWQLERKMEQLAEKKDKGNNGG